MNRFASFFFVLLAFVIVAAFYLWLPYVVDVLKLPLVYAGAAVMLVAFTLVFIGGFYYHKSMYADGIRKKEQMEREMIRKVVKKIETEKPS